MWKEIAGDYPIKKSDLTEAVAKLSEWRLEWDSKSPDYKMAKKLQTAADLGDAFGAIRRGVEAVYLSPATGGEFESDMIEAGEYESLPHNWRELHASP